MKVARMDIKSLIKNNQLTSLLCLGSFGIEKEGVRTDEKNRLALTDHPSQFGDRSFHPYIQTDFSEGQLELVTPPLSTLTATYSWMRALNDIVLRSLENDEVLWPFSMPSILPEEEHIPIIRVSDQKEIRYRKQLAEKYGRRKQLISGVHFNFAFSDQLIAALYKVQDTFQTEKDVRNALHMKLARNYLRYEWMLTYLFGASPVADASFFNGDEPLKEPIRSLRNSRFGYHNEDKINVRYKSLETYVNDIEQLVEKKILSEEREYYGTARLRGKTKQVRGMLDSGVNYVEFRSFDLNPYSDVGLSFEQAQFSHLFFIGMLWLDQTASDEDIQEGNRRNEKTARENPYSLSAYKEEALMILEKLSEIVNTLSLGESFREVLAKAYRLFDDPSQTLSARIMDHLKEKTFLEYGQLLSEQYKKEAYKQPFLLRGFETMEMSTQLLIFDAIQRGIEVDVLDERDQFLKLSHEDHIEYVKNGNMTAKDTYISHWIMENKTVTKKILKENGFIVPAGEEYHSLEQAVAAYHQFKHKGFVVKPKSTNYGLGISVFKTAPSQNDFKEALKIAFEEDEAILVEEYAEGTEYRFFVLDGAVQAVLLRIPANVLGDGQHTINELINQKNSHPLRGSNHRAPLEKIKKGNIEKLMLKEQGYAFDSIPDEGTRVYLRENSNISTGGDSIDFTEEMHESYKEHAVKMAESIGARVTGVDLIIPDYTKPSLEHEPGYTCIEANFNPAMHMHAYVYKGKGQRLTQGVLDMLFPELKAE